MLTRRWFLRSSILAAIPVAIAFAQAPQSQTQTGPATLTVTGDIPAPLTLKAEDLAAMPREKASVPDQDGTEIEYEGVALREDEKPRLVRDLGAKNYFMLRNHGLITVADNVPDAFLLMYTFESACMIQVRAQAGGCRLVSIDPSIIATAQQQAAAVTNESVGALAWPALLRKLDRIDPSYRN